MSSPVTIQPSTADAYFYEGAATTNYGTGTTLEVYAAAGQHRPALCSFDFHTSVPAGATITAATLSLYISSTGGARTIGVYRLLRTAWEEIQATWRIFKTGFNWGTYGALNITDNPDYTETDAATATSTAYHTWTTWDVKNQVQTALDSVSGVAHFLIKDTADGAVAQYFNSRRFTTDTTKCPKLYIEYTVPGATPSGASFLLRMI